MMAWVRLLVLVLVVFSSCISIIHAAECSPTTGPFVSNTGDECILQATTTYSYTTFTMNGGTVYIEYDSNTPHFTLVATQAVTISAGAVLSAKGRGTGAAESGVATLPYSGAGHGGNGGGSNPGQAYDSFTDPQELGKAGGNNVVGGGVIRIQTPTLIVNGTIDASGDDCLSNCGGGAGGSVYLELETLSGTGSIMANGGSGPASTNGGGGGGIVSINCTVSLSFGGSISAYGGLGGQPGGAGIVYLKSSSSSAGVVIVNNNNRNITTEEPVGTSSSGVTPLTQTVTVDEVSVLNGAKVYVNGETVTTDTFTIGSNASTSFALNIGYTVNNLVIHGNAYVPTTTDPSFYTSRLITTAGSVLSGDTVTFACDICVLDGDVLISNIVVNPNANANFSMSGTWNVLATSSINGAGGVATISGDLTAASISLDNFEEVHINSNLTAPSIVLGATVSIYHNSASILDSSTTTLNSPNIYVYGTITSPSFIELNGRTGDLIQIFGTVNTLQITVRQVIAVEFGGSVNVDTVEIENAVRDVVVSGNLKVSNNAALTMNYQSISITTTATITVPTSLNLTSSSLSVFGRIEVPTLVINGQGDLTRMGFTTSATSPVIFSSGSIYMNNSMHLDVTSLNITCLGSTTFGGMINTTNLRHSLSGNVIIDGTLRVGTNVSFSSSSNNISISSTGLLTAPTISLTGNYVNLGGAVDTTSFLVTAPAIGVAGGSVSASSLRFQSTGSLVVRQTSLIKATAMDFNVSSFSVDSSSSISADSTVTENPAAYYLTVCPGGSYGGGGGGSDLTVYGTIFRPTDKGMPGCSSAPYNGGAAGGTIKISVKNSIEINGKISASGSSGDTGGSGGSIWISSGQLSGTGGIYAHGGDSVADGAGGGGGGRIAIYSSSSFLGAIAAYGGKATSTDYHGGPGTIYTEDSASSFTSLIINNGNGTLVRRGLRAYVIDNLASFRFSEVAIGGGAELEFSGLSTTSIVISTLSGDLTGNLVVVLNTQTFNISNLTSSVATPAPSGFGVLSSSITVNSGTVNLPSSFVIPSPVSLDVRRTICGVSKMMILGGGACRLSAGASSCQAGLGIFTFDVIVQSNGTLASINAAIPTVRGQVCAMNGSVIQNINATQLWRQDTSSLEGPCVDYIPTTTSSTTSTTSTTTTTSSTTSSTTSTTSSTTSATAATTSSTTSTSTTGTSTSTTGTPVVLPGIVPASGNASRRFVETTWTAPTNPSGLALTYTLEVINITSGSWRLVYQGPNLNANATNLEPNTTHTFRIWASTSAGNGESRNFTATTKQLDPPSVSLAPTYRAYGKDYVVALIQYPLDDGGLPVLNYTLYFSLDNSSWTVSSVIAPTNVQRFTSLNPTTKHYFKSYSTNSLGRSTESPVGIISTESSICGDGTCDPTESCASCSSDCRACQYPACPGTPECSSQGTCDEGVCNCNKDFSGPDCSIPVERVPPVDVTPNATAPSIIITPNTKGNNNNTTSTSTTGTSGNDVDISVSFNILFDYIAEVNEQGSVIAKESMLDRNFTISTQKLNLTDGSSVDQLKYTMKFNNGGSASVYLAIFKSASTIIFANKTLNIPVNGVKYSMSIDNWNFASFRNKLQIAIKTDALSPSGSECSEIQASSDTQGNLRWIQVSLNGVILYGTFEEVALIDGEVRSVQYKYDGEQRTIINVPHFWFNAEFDPDFQVLLDPNGQSKTECGDNSNNKKGGVSKYLLIGVVAGAIAAIIAASIVGAVIMNKRKKKREERMSSRGSTMMKPVNSTTSTLSSSSSSAPPSPSPSRSEKVNLV